MNGNIGDPLSELNAAIRALGKAVNEEREADIGYQAAQSRVDAGKIAADDARARVDRAVILYRNHVLENT